MAAPEAGQRQGPAKFRLTKDTGETARRHDETLCAAAPSTSSVPMTSTSSVSHRLSLLSFQLPSLCPRKIAVRCLYAHRSAERLVLYDAGGMMLPFPRSMIQ